MFSNAAQTTTHDCQRTFLGAIADRLSSHTVIAIVWILSLSIALPPLFGWSYYAPEDNGIRWVFVHAKYKSLGNVLDFPNWKSTSVTILQFQLCSGMGGPRWNLIHHLSTRCWLGFAKCYPRWISHWSDSISKTGRHQDYLSPFQTSRKICLGTSSIQYCWWSILYS